MLTVHDPVVRDDAAQEVRQPGHQEHRHRGEQNPSGGGERSSSKFKTGKEASPVALHPVRGDGGCVEAHAAGPQGGGGGAGEEGVVRHLLGLDGSLHLQRVVCSE